MLLYTKKMPTQTSRRYRQSKSKTSRKGSNQVNTKRSRAVRQTGPFQLSVHDSEERLQNSSDPEVRKLYEEIRHLKLN